ncbi:MAG: hypothetical protein L6243_04055 [Candidatus Altiarchaeales archaeon]|nr:hypothetical protein [Candidatus Altiarchaeota archaeon]MBU4437584.1 hypothetical protein [Candidatus Altiarchaeota archaeon]MCG2782744.1 hypothetical protein [Candidatus Altiarchaeales archaeon]
MLKERIIRDRWEVFTYNNLEKFMKKRKKSIKEFNKLSEFLKSKGATQTNINKF